MRISDWSSDVCSSDLLDALVPTLQNLKALQGLQFLHVVTRKGQGYKLAEADPVLYHGPGKFDPAVGIQQGQPSARKTFTQDRKSVVSGKSVPVRVDLGGRRLSQKKTQKQ